MRTALLLSLFLAACGGSQPPAVRVILDCSREPARELVEDLAEDIWLDGGPENRKASERLVDLAWRMAGEYGLDVVRCAIARAREALMVEAGTQRALASEDDTPGDKAARKRAEDLLDRLSE